MKPKLLRRKVKVVGVVFISFAIFSGCTSGSEPNIQQTAAPQQQSIKSVKASKAVKQKIADPIEQIGNVESSVQFEIVAKADGDVGQMLKKRGDTVQAGDVIVKLTSAEAKLRKERADLAVKTAQQALNKARTETANSIRKMELGLAELTRNFNKARNDYDSGLITKSQLGQMENQLKNAQLDYDQLKQNANQSDLVDSLTNAQLSKTEVYQELANLEVKASVSGLLSDMYAGAGMSLQAGAPIGRIQKLDPIKIKAQLTDAEAQLLRGKTEVVYYIQGTTEFYKGSINYLAGVVDPESKTYELDIEVANPDMKLKPGMKVRIQLTAQEEGIAVTVPTYSVVNEGENTYVFVLSGDTVEKRNVQLGRVNEPYQEVLSGVREGEMVVVSGLNQLKDKEKVQLDSVE